MTTTTPAPTLGRRAYFAWLRRFARTTPGIVVLIALVVAASCMIAGVVCARQLDDRIARHREVLNRSEPLAYAAQNMYAALSAIDAAAATAFLSSGMQTPPMRARYQQALAGAASALADATAGATDADTRTAVAEISVQLATYTGLVESARANNLQGGPIGSAYLREASSLMQTKLRPGAERIYTRNLVAVRDGERAVGSAPTTGLVLLGVVLTAIGVGSVVLLARTNRQFNLGLVVAATLALISIVSILVATRLVSGDIERARVEGTARFEQLAKARILAQQARTDETLELISRGDIAAGEKSFYGHIDELVAQLGTGPSTAGEGVQNWIAGHRKQVEVYLRGDYPAAVAQAIDVDPDGSAAKFAIVETSLRDEIEQTRASLRDRVSQAGRALSWGPTGVLVLMAVAASATVGGLWPRLKEFL